MSRGHESAPASEVSRPARLDARPCMDMEVHGAWPPGANPSAGAEALPVGLRYTLDLVEARSRRPCSVWLAEVTALPFRRREPCAAPVPIGDRSARRIAHSPDWQAAAGPQARSETGASGPTRLQAAIPFSIAWAEEYVSLLPITSLFAARSTK